MTRKEILDYLTENYKTTLAMVGLLPVDTPESLAYVIDDALRADDWMGEAEKRVQQLIYDRADMIGVEANEQSPAPDAVEEEE